jgi:dTDP-4-dehydrorhamnose reductase
MRVAILGASGMVGHALLDLPFDVVPFTRKEYDVLSSGPNLNNVDALKGFDYIINSIGIVKQRIDKSGGKKQDETIVVNTLFPLVLASYCHHWGTKLIHISTDCVFSGESGYYKESDEPDFDKEDIYSKTKSDGEPERAMVIRTSFVGPEKNNFLGLMEWTKKQSGEINGFTNHLWNGITTKQFAKSIQKIIEENLYEEGIFHIFSSEPVTKYDMVSCFNEHFDLGLTVNPIEHSQKIIRTLSTEKDLNERLSIPSFYEMVKEI